MWPPLSTAQEEEGHAQDHEEGEEERGLKGGGEVCHLPPREGRSLELMQLHFPRGTRVGGCY